MEMATLLKAQCLKTKRTDQESTKARRKIRFNKVHGKWISDKVSSPNSI